MKRYGNVKGFTYRAQQPLPEPKRKRGTIRCTACRLHKPLSEFVWNDRRHGMCRDCHLRAYEKAYKRSSRGE